MRKHYRASFTVPEKSLDALFILTPAAISPSLPDVDGGMVSHWTTAEGRRIKTAVMSSQKTRQGAKHRTGASGWSLISG